MGVFGAVGQREENGEAHVFREAVLGGPSEGESNSGRWVAFGEIEESVGVGAGLFADLIGEEVESMSTDRFVSILEKLCEVVLIELSGSIEGDEMAEAMRLSLIKNGAS